MGTTPARRSAGALLGRPGPIRRLTGSSWWLPAVAAAGLTALATALSAYLTRPFWYDEIWRGHFVSEPIATFWSELSVANTPSALGWLGLTRLSGELFGWHTWALRLPGFVALPALGVAMTLLLRRFSGSAAALTGVCWLCLNATFLDLATQLKPYTIETLATVAVVLLWLSGPAPDRHRARVVRRTAAGVVALCAVPAVFVVVPLAAVELLRGPDRRRRAVEVLPALLLVAAHTLFFLGHQSAQRAGDYWDTQFVAGRDPLDAVAFVGEQVWRILTGSPPGIDQFDPSLVPGFVGLPEHLSWLLAPALLALGVVGVRALVRGADGRLLLAVLGGAELLMLAASTVRFWPFGPTRTNQFVVPLFVLIVVVGGDQAARSCVRRLRTARSGARPASSTSAWFAVKQGGVAVAGLVALCLVAGVAMAGATSGDRLVWDRRDRLRGLDLMVDAAVATRRLARPGDLVVVGGRLARPGWIYAMEASVDGPRLVAGLPPLPAGVPSGEEPPRTVRGDTVFVDPELPGPSGRPVSLVDQLRRDPRPNRMIVFVFDLDERAMAPGLAALRAQGWCAGPRWPFRLTGTVTVYDHCPVPEPTGRDR